MPTYIQNGQRKERQIYVESLGLSQAKGIKLRKIKDIKDKQGQFLIQHWKETDYETYSLYKRKMIKDNIVGD